jgi:hypothetical protein
MRRFSYIRPTEFPSPSHFLVLNIETSGLHSDRSSFISDIAEDSKHTSIKISSRKMQLPIFFMTINGLSIIRTVHSVYFTFALIYHRTKWLRSVFCHLLLMMWWNMKMSMCALTLYSPTSSTSVNNTNRTPVCMMFMTSNYFSNSFLFCWP